MRKFWVFVFSEIRLILRFFATLLVVDMGKVKAGKSVWRWESRSREIGERDEGGKKNKKKNGKLH